MDNGKCGDGSRENQYKIAQSLLNFTGGTLQDTEKSFRAMKIISMTGDIYTSVKTSYLFDARNNGLQFELLLLVAAVKSVIGFKRNFTKTYREVLIRRMYGCDKPINRYQFNKLIDHATSRGLFTLIPAGRGYYVSIRYKVDELKEQLKLRINKYESQRIKRIKAGKDLMNLRKELRNKILGSSE